MSDFNLTNFISKFGYKNISTNLSQAGSNQKAAEITAAAQQITSSLSSVTSSASSVSLQMSSLAGNETAVYIKDLLNLPKNLNEYIYMVQRGLTLTQMNTLLSQQFIQQKSGLISSTQAQILAQLQGLTTEELRVALQNQLLNTNSNSSLKILQIFSNGMLNLSDIAVMLQTNGKAAVTKLILTMATATKQGITDLSQLKDTAKLINASVAAASQENSAQTLKTFLLLYLPWLPLQEGIDFDIEIYQNPNNEENDSILVITINTINFGKITAVLILETSNSVHVNIECADEFPKDALLLRIRGEEKYYSMQSVVSFQTTNAIHSEIEHPKAAVTMSSMSEINPYMLLMAHALIRNTIMIDNEVSNGVFRNTDIEDDKQ